MSRYNEDHLYRGAINYMTNQLPKLKLHDCYTTDLVMEIVDDPRIGDAAFNITAYRKAIGKEEWAALLARHAHDKKND